MLSRVETINQLFILGDPPASKFYANHAALNELQRLERVSINRNKPPWEQTFNWSKKITLLNCRSLTKHIDDIKVDPNLGLGDLICLNETWLKTDMVEEQWNIPGFELHLNSNGDGKGVATYFKRGEMQPVKDIKKHHTQIMLLSSPEIDVVNVYRSQGMNNDELANDLRTLIDKSKFTLICGDFNLCYIESQTNAVTTTLEHLGFTQLVHEASHFKGGHIDHIYSNHSHEHFLVDVCLYSPYYLAKDHDAICVTITKTPAKVVPGFGRYTAPR